MCNTPSSMRATLLRTTPSSSSTLRYQSCASSGMGMYARSLLPAMRQPKLNWANALSSAAASCVATKKYSLYMGLVWSDQAPSRLNQNSFCITKASCIRLCGIMRRTFSQVSRSFPWGVWTRYQRTRPCWLLVVAPLNAPGSCSWRRVVCSMFSPPSFGFAMHANAGAFRTCFSLAARRSRKSTGFCIFRQTTLYEQLISVCPDYAKCTASRYISIPPYKNLYLFVQQKKPLNQRLFLFRHEKRRPPFVDGRLCKLL